MALPWAVEPWPLRLPVTQPAGFAVAVPPPPPADLLLVSSLEALPQAVSARTAASAIPVALPREVIFTAGDLFEEGGALKAWRPGIGPRPTLGR